MKKISLIVPVLLGVGHSYAKISDVLKKAGETVQEGVYTARDIAEAAVGKAEQTYERLVPNSVDFTNNSQDTVVISIESNGSSYTENDRETFEVKPGEKIALSPDLTNNTKVHVTKMAEQTYSTMLPKNDRVQIRWDGTSFSVTQND